MRGQGGVGVQQKNSAKTMRPASILPHPIQTLQPNDTPPDGRRFYFEKMVGNEELSRGPKDCSPLKQTRSKLGGQE